jgi:hypothetical protein
VNEQRDPDDLIAVSPKNYQRVVRYIVSQVPGSVIVADGREIDPNDDAYISQKGLGEIRDFEMRCGSQPVMGFHDHPREMWITERHRSLAELMHAEGSLVIEFPRLG